MHNAETKDKLVELTARKRGQTPCSAAIQFDPHSFYTQRSLLSAAIGCISRTAILVKITYLPNRTVFVAGIMHSNQVH